MHGRIGSSVNSFLAASSLSVPSAWLVQVASKEGETTSKQDEGLPEYVLRFHPPIVMHNLLPYPVTITLTDARSSKPGGVPAQVGTWNIQVGGSEDVYFFDLSKKLKMGIEMQVKFT